MDLTYPAEAESFRKEIRAWLEESLPEGWFEPGFSRSSSPVVGSVPAGPSNMAARGSA
jgi:hypothetical protein